MLWLRLEGYDNLLFYFFIWKVEFVLVSWWVIVISWVFVFLGVISWMLEGMLFVVVVGSIRVGWFERLKGCR